jgi:hypothetical protein
MNNFDKWILEKTGLSIKEFYLLCGKVCFGAFMGNPQYFLETVMIGYMEEYLLLVHHISIGMGSDIYERIEKGELFSTIRFNRLKQEIEICEKRVARRS